jgi:hypothetical protein
MTTATNLTKLSLASVGIDIGKEVFHLVGFDADGKVALRRKIKRLALVSEFEKLPLSIPLVMYHFDVEFLAPAVSCLMTDEAGCDCTV